MNYYYINTNLKDLILKQPIVKKKIVPYYYRVITLTINNDLVRL